MADDRPQSGEKAKFDPFKADDPVLPGVPSKTQGPVATGVKVDFKDPRVLAGGSIGLVVLVMLAWLVFGPAEAPPLAPVTTPAATAAPGAAEGAPAAAAEGSPRPTAAPPILNLPALAGTVDEFPQAWATKKVLISKVTGRVPALIIRLPGGSPRRADGYWGLLLSSPYGRCELEFVTDLKKLADDYGYRARHPMVVDPCNMAVFDPLRLGDIGGALSRGAVVQGTTPRPPLAMELKIENNRIMVLQTE